MNEYEQVTFEVIRIINENPTKDGVEKALRYFHAKDSDLKEKMIRGVNKAAADGSEEETRQKYYAVMSKVKGRFEELAKKYPAIAKDIDYLRGVALTIAR